MLRTCVQTTLSKKLWKTSYGTL